MLATAAERRLPELDHTNTLAVWLKNAGYYTIEVGKYLNGYGKPNPAEVPPGWSEWHAGVNLAFLGGTMNNNGVVTRLPNDESGYQTDVWAAIVRDAIHAALRPRSPSSSGSRRTCRTRGPARSRRPARPRHDAAGRAPS